MAKIYTKKTETQNKVLPKKETVDLILQFSKAYSVLKVGKLKIENISN